MIFHFLLLFTVFSKVFPPDIGPKGNPKNKWMLTNNEILKSRDGHPKKNGIALYTENNSMEPMFDGISWGKKLYDEIEKTEKDDFINFYTFEIESDMMLVPNHNDPIISNRSRVDNTLIRAFKRGVAIRGLVNTNVLKPFAASSFCKPINELCDPYDCCIPESRHSDLFRGSLHAKLWVIQRQGEVIAIMGSDDAYGGRWDTQFHDFDLDRRLEPPEHYPVWGWHSIMFYARGPVVRDLAIHFYSHWTESKRQYFFEKYDLLPYIWSEPKVAVNPGKLTLQLTQTYGCKGAEDGIMKKYHPRGDYSFLASFKKLCQNAKQYIYLEDQFMYYDEAIQILVDALPHVEKVILLTNHHDAFKIPIAGPDLNQIAGMTQYYQEKAFRLIFKNPQLAKKVRIYCLVPEYFDPELEATPFIYTHAKLYIADDEFMIAGSNGIERTGFTNDVEISLGFFDNSTNQYVKNYRKQIWGEHLRIDPKSPILDDPLKAIDEFAKSAASATKRLRFYKPEKIWAPYASIMYNMFQPDGRCDD